MSAPVRQSFRPVRERLAEYPTITRRESDLRQRGQVSYLLWRLDMFLADRAVPRDQRRKMLQPIRQQWALGRYEMVCQMIEKVMKAFVQRELSQIQAIFDER